MIVRKLQQIGCVFVCIGTGRGFDGLLVKKVNLLSYHVALSRNSCFIVAFVLCFIIILNTKMSFLLLIPRTIIFSIYIFAPNCRFVFLTIISLGASSSGKGIEPIMFIKVYIQIIKLNSADTHHFIAVKSLFRYILLRRTVHILQIPDI